MRRVAISPRQDWQAIVESQGFHFHTLEGEPYWNEEAFYAFSKAEIEELEQATYALDKMCQEAVDYVITNNLFEPFDLDERYHDWIRQSWDQDEYTIYGRFDLALTPGGPPKLLEYNADTPTALLEAAVIQWTWFLDTRPGKDQFNSIHDRLLEIWKTLKSVLNYPVHFSSLSGHLEDYMTVNYLRDVAMQAGHTTEYLAVEEVRWHEGRQQFVDSKERDVRTMFKLYPWEWMFCEKFGPHLLTSQTRWLEPPWKVLLSNKAILPVLWRLFPESPYLLRAEYEPFGDTFVEKPRQGREGANVRLVQEGQTLLETEGAYDGRSVYQALSPLPVFESQHAVIGSWMVNGYACGLGIREDDAPVTRNTSRFVPHVME